MSINPSPYSAAEDSQAKGGKATRSINICGSGEATEAIGKAESEAECLTAEGVRRRREVQAPEHIIKAEEAKPLEQSAKPKLPRRLLYNDEVTGY